MKKILRTIARCGLLAALPLLVLADGDPCPPDKLCNPLRFESLMDFLNDILRVVVQYGALLIVFFIVFAGFKFVVARGNTEKLAEAKTMLMWIIVGAFVLLGVYVIRAAICGSISGLGMSIDCSS